MAKDIPFTHDLTRSDLRLAQMLKALGSPIRFGIMQYLATHPVCITGDIVQWTDLAQSTVSQHLKVLRDAGLIKGEVEGPATCYCIDPAGVQFLKTQVGGWLPDCCAEPPDRRSSDNSSQVNGCC